MKETHNFAQRVRSGDVLMGTLGTLASLPSPEICEILDQIKN